jgi:sphingolipid delta-4 desaturase
MGHDPNLKWVVAGMVLFQIITSYFIRDFHWFPFFMIAYCIGGVLNHSLTLAIHEIAHNLAFGHSKPLLNRAIGMIANFPLGIPMSVSFKKYHLEHHKYQGDEEYDMDLPSRMEAALFHTTFTKLIWLLLQPLFYTLRPLFLRPKPVTMLEVINLAMQVVFDIVIVYFFGWRSLFYLTFSTFLAMGLHPVAGHFISEHYVFVKGYETYSYYGPLNWITFNVGYHNEHHDFPNIPGSRLPEVSSVTRLV